MTSSNWYFNMHKFFKRTAPFFALKVLAKVHATPNNVKNVKRYKKLIDMEKMVCDSFSHFTFYDRDSSGFLDM